MKSLYYAVVGLKAYSKQFKATGVNIKPTKENKVNVVTVDDKELSIHYIPDINKMGIVFGGLYYNAITKKTCIMVDDNFYSLPVDVQDAVINHEVGHYVLGHYLNKGIKCIWEQLVLMGEIQCANDEEKNLLIQNTLANRDYSQELEADSFAVSKCGKEAVEEMLNIIYKMTFSKEIVDRYEHVSGRTFKSPLEELISSCKTMSIDDI